VGRQPVIRRATPADAEQYCHVHAEMVIDTYRYTMPPAFADYQRSLIPLLIPQRTEDFAASLAAEEDGRAPQERSWVADLDGTIVGVAASGTVHPEWEDELGVRRLPGVDLNLVHLYTRPSTHGTGLGQQLLDIALPTDDPVYLWLIADNERARRFYRRNGFSPDPIEYVCGPEWHERPLRRMLRGVQST
jgi:GNAT superfamily N-acetyltransferase